MQKALKELSFKKTQLKIVCGTEQRVLKRKTTREAVLTYCFKN